MNKKLTLFINPIKLLLLLVLFYSFTGIINKRINNTPFNVDEEAWVIRTSYYNEFISGNVRNEDIWNSYGAIDQPLLMAYLAGLSYSLWPPVSSMTAAKAVEIADKCCLTESRVIDGRTVTCLSKIYVCEYLYHLNFREFPECMKQLIPFIIRNRIISAIFMLLTLILVFFFGRRLAGYWVGVAATVFLMNNWALSTQMFLGVTDALLMFFCVLTVLLGLSAGNMIKKNRIRDYNLYCILVGISSGLALSTKLNGGYSIVIVAMGLLVITIKYRLSMIKLILGMVLVGIVSSTFFVLLNPFLYNNPLINTVKMYDYRIKKTRYYQADPEITLNTVPQRIIAINRNLFKQSNNNGKYSIINALFFIVGIFLVIFRSVKKDNYMWLFVALIGWIIYLLLFLTLDWSRYYIPPVPWMSVVQSVTLVFITNNCWKLVISIHRRFWK